jgi:GGDEF domain-containing protein
MPTGPPRRRRARPVAGAPIEALLSRSEELAKGWLLDLIEQAPLDEAPGIIGADLVRDGPRVCAAAVAALADDRDLRRIERGGALELLVARTGVLAGARDAAATLRAVDALQSAIWGAVRDLMAPSWDGDLAAAAAERLAAVAECIRTAALRELETARGSLRAVAEPKRSLRLWVSALEDEIARAARLGTPLSLLLVELEDAGRVLAVEDGEQAGELFDRFAEALRSVLRRRDVLARESDSRAWIIGRETARPGAQALADRIVMAVEEVEPWRGAPLAVTIGIAVLGEDGEDAPSMLEAAEEDRFAASAQGLSVVADPDE